MLYGDDIIIGIFASFFLRDCNKVFNYYYFKKNQKNVERFQELKDLAIENFFDNNKN